jgi:hypothetical protein
MVGNDILIIMGKLVSITICILLAIYFYLKRRAAKREALQRAYAETLAKQERELFEKREKMKRGAVSVKIVHIENNNYQFQIINSGGVDVTNVEMKLLLGESADDPIIPSEYDTKLPIVKLARGNMVSIDAVQYAGCPTKYTILLKWVEPKGARVRDEVCIDLSDVVKQIDTPTQQPLI